MQAQPALLGVEEHAHQPARLVAEDAVGGGVDFAVDELEAVHGFADGLASAGEQAGEAAGQRKAGRRRGWGRSARRCSRVRVMRKMLREWVYTLAHEPLDALAGGAFAVAEVVGDGGLEVLAQHVHGPVDVVMHLGARRAAGNRRPLPGACARSRR